MAVIAAMLGMPAGAAAQDQSAPPSPDKPTADQQQPKERDRLKAPAPPLFPKHRRGLYRNAGGIEVIDATPQSPPLETDDPGVPDKGEYEINLTTHGDYAKQADRVDMLLVDANYGILPSIAGYKLPTQVKFEFPVTAVRQSVSPSLSVLVLTHSVSNSTSTTMNIAASRYRSIRRWSFAPREDAECSRDSGRTVRR